MCGVGAVETTPDKSKAMMFRDAGLAHEFWRTQSKLKPFREDGYPNRPLTAFTVELLHYEDAP